MTSAITCICGRVYQISPGMEGKAIRCKACGEKVHVPVDGGEDVLSEADLAPGPVPVVPHDELEKLPTHRHRIVSATPDMLTFSLSRYIKCNPLTIYIPFVILICVPLAAGLLHLSVAIGILIGFVVAAYLFSEGPAKRTQRKMHSGSLCAAKVIKTNPYSVAVLTNLSHNGSANKLAIGIRRQRLGNMAGGPPKTGDRVLASVNYSPKIVDAAWDDFSAFVVNCGCDDLEQIEKATAAIDPADWKVLDEHLADLKIKPGELLKLWETK